MRKFLAGAVSRVRRRITGSKVYIHFNPESRKSWRDGHRWFVVRRLDGTLTEPHMVECMSLVLADLTRRETALFYHEMKRLIVADKVPANTGTYLERLRSDSLGYGQGHYGVPCMTESDYVI